MFDIGWVEPRDLHQLFMIFINHKFFIAHTASHSKDLGCNYVNLRMIFSLSVGTTLSICILEKSEQAHLSFHVSHPPNFNWGLKTMKLSNIISSENTILFLDSIWSNNKNDWVHLSLKFQPFRACVQRVNRHFFFLLAIGSNAVLLGAIPDLQSIRLHKLARAGTILFYFLRMSLSRWSRRTTANI